MRDFIKDIRFALRTLAKNPGFAGIGIVTLALGMAVNTTVFSVVNGFLLRPLPVSHPEQITVLALKQASVGGNSFWSSSRAKGDTKLCRFSRRTRVFFFFKFDGVGRPNGFMSKKRLPSASCGG